ncbi:MAG: phosphatase PAP2 family protein [Gemmatimonadales bacterium]
MQNTLIRRIAEGDHALYLRLVIRDSASREKLVAWRMLTHAGGLYASVAFALLPLFLADAPGKVLFVQAGWALTLSSLAVQALKRNVVRTRPVNDAGHHAYVKLPDRFSFPSGHATAVMSVAYCHALNFPLFAAPLLLLAVLVGVSRVRLGVHFPGDVVAGQLIGIASGALVRAAW